MKIKIKNNTNMQYRLYPSINQDCWDCVMLYPNAAVIVDYPTGPTSWLNERKMNGDLDWSEITPMDIILDETL